MDQVLSREIPAFTARSSMLFAHPTGMANIWHPAIEHILLPEQQIPPTRVNVTVRAGHTGPRTSGTWQWKAYQAVTHLLSKPTQLDYTGKFIFDARFDTDKNPAHILDNISTPILFAKQVLNATLQQAVEIHVILNARSSDLARTAYGLLNIPIISTDENVYGNVVTVSTHHLFSVKAQLFDLEFQGCKDPSLDRIFIPRRGNRRLANNDEVEAFLYAQGFKTCYFEDFSLSEQWSMARHAKTVVAVHGAAVSPLIFNRQGLGETQPSGGVKVVEIMSPGWIHSGFRNQINAVNGRWCAVRGQITPAVLKAVDFADGAPDSLKSPFKDPFKADCDALQMALDYVNRET